MTNLSSNFQVSLKLIVSLIFTATFLIGCDSNEKSLKNNFTVQQKVQKYAKDTVIKGKVTNKKGTILSGEIRVVDSKGAVIVTKQLKNDYHYSVTIPAGTLLPIELKFYPKTKSSDVEKMTAAIIYPNIKKYDINELTTLIAKKAKAMGGYTHVHMVSAAESTISAPDANKTTAGFRGDPTKQYGGWH